MANLNKVLLIGNLTRDPELRYLQNGTALCDFGIAVNRKFKSQSGEQKEEVLFVDVTAFGKQAEMVGEYFQKGRSIFIEGRLKLDQWDGQDGQKHSKIKVTLEQFQFVDPRPGGAGGGGGERRTAPAKPAAPPASGPKPPVQQKPATPGAPPAENDFDTGEDSIPF